MSEPRGTIGEVLKGLGRIDETDIATALEHQRDHGGFFGEALVACGIVSEEELEFGLASQFDLPYLFPDAEAVDLEAAALVSPEWALTHLALPILRTSDTLKVVVDSPLKEEPLEELARKTELAIEVGLASPASIRNLIREVYARSAARDEERRDPLSLESVLDAVDDVEAPRWGISMRGGRAYAWWDDRGTVRRRPLSGDWRGSLEAHLVPPPSRAVQGSRSRWEGRIGRGADVRGVSVRCLVDESGLEYLFLPGEAEPASDRRFPSPPPGIVAEIAMLARAGTARFAFTAEPEELGHAILPHLPELTLDPSWRSVHVAARDLSAADEAFSVRLPSDPDTWEDEIEALKAFHFDVVTVDLSGEDHAWVPDALDIASVAFLLWSGGDLGEARKAGIRWRLSVRRDDDEELSWSLESLDA